MSKPRMAAWFGQMFAPRMVQSWARLMPQSLLGRLTVVMVAGVLLTQVIANSIWAWQLRKESELEARTAAAHLAHAAAGTVRYFASLPLKYRPLMIEQLRGMGGTRFFVTVNHAAVPVRAIPAQSLSTLVGQTIGATMQQELPHTGQVRIAFAWPQELVVSDSGMRVGDLPESWVQHILLLQPRAAPILTIQVELEAGNWLYLAGLMPNPYFLESGNPLAFDRIVLQALSLAAVLIFSLLVVRQITRPLAALSEAAAAFGTAENRPTLPTTGSREFIRTAQAFDAMRERIARYLEERQRLFISISHDLRTPITRLRLRAELLDDEHLSREFEEDLDELDMMVKGALQCVKDSDIYENPTEIKLDALLARMIRGVRLAGHEVSYQESGLSVQAKPLALKRAIGNLLDNALFYGQRAELAVRSRGGQIEIEIRDHGPGVPEAALASLFDPYVRLAHGRQQNSQGMGLGLGIARGIVEAHGGQLRLANHAQGGLVATMVLPAQRAPDVTRAVKLSTAL